MTLFQAYGGILLAVAGNSKDTEWMSKKIGQFMQNDLSEAFDDKLHF